LRQAPSWARWHCAELGGTVLAASIDIQHLPLFVSAGLLLNLTPGADMALVVRHSAANGLRAGAMAALGVGAGCLVHTLAAALGLATLLAGSPAAFNALRWAGAAYLVWMGWGLLRSAVPSTAAATDAPAPTAALHRVFWQGFLTNALNPKVALFFLAFLPQFVNGNAGHVPVQIITLGLIFIALVVVIFGTLGYFAGSFAQKLLANRRFSETMGLVSAAVFIGLGVKLALSGNQ